MAIAGETFCCEPVCSRHTPGRVHMERHGLSVKIRHFLGRCFLGRRMGIWMGIWMVTVLLLGSACSSPQSVRGDTRSSTTSDMDVLPISTHPQYSPAPAGSAAMGAPASTGVVPGNLDLSKFGCGSRDDCTSTCDSGCVNVQFGMKHQDTCVNIRAFQCSCVSQVCYTDGQPPRTP